MKYWDFIDRFRPQGLPLPAGILVIDKQTTLRARRMPYRYWVQHPGRLDNLLILGTVMTAAYVCLVGGDYEQSALGRLSTTTVEWLGRSCSLLEVEGEILLAHSALERYPEQHFQMLQSYWLDVRPVIWVEVAAALRLIPINLLAPF